MTMQDIPAGVTEQMVALSTGITVRVLRGGSGPTLVMAPGWTCTADYFNNQLAELSKTHDVVAYDPRGHGQSDKPLTGNNFTTRAGDLAALLDALDINKATLLGWSFGVYDVLAYVRDNGLDRVAGVVICDSPPTCACDPTDSTAWGEAPLTMDGIVMFLRLTIDAREAFWTAYAKEMIGLPEDTADDHPDVARIVELGLQTPEHVAVATMADGVGTDLSEAAKTAADKVPTLVIAKEAWADTAKQWTETNLPSASFATMPYHMGFVTNPDEFNEILRQHLPSG